MSGFERFSGCIFELSIFCSTMAAKLRLLQFCENGAGVTSRRVGVEVDGGRVVDVTAMDPSIPRDMRSFLQGFDANSAAAAKYDVEEARRG